MRGVVKGLVGAACAGALLIGSSGGASAAPGPHFCDFPPGSVIAPAAQEAGPNAGPNAFHWGPLPRDGAPNAPGQAVVGACILDV